MASHAIFYTDFPLAAGHGLEPAHRYAAGNHIFIIEFVFSQISSLLILKAENSLDGRLVLKAKEEFPITDKADRKSHGIGLATSKARRRSIRKQWISKQRAGCRL